MNRLKYVLGINVRRIPSHGALISEQRAEGVNRKYHQTEVHVSKSARGLLCRARRENDSRNLHYSGHLKNGTVSVQTRSRKPSVETIYSVPFTHKRRNTLCLVKKPPLGRRCVVKNMEKLVNSVRELKVQRIDELGELIGKEPRSYAQLIASYNQAIYGSEGMGNPKDSLNCAITGIRRGPFSTTATVVPSKWKNKHKGNKSGNICSTGFNVFNQDAKFSSEAAPKRRCQYDGEGLVKNIEEKYNEFERTYLSYATIMEKYSDTLNLAPDMLARSTHLIHKRNVSTKLDEILFDSKNVDNKTETISSTRDSDISERLTNEMEMQERDNWMTKVDGVIKDLKRITSKTETKMNDSWMLQSVKERALWLDRVVQAHKRSVAERKASSNVINLFKGNESIDALSTAVDNPMPVANEGEELPFTFMANEKPSNPIAEYIKRGPVSSNSSPHNSSQTPSKVSTGQTKEPQIELRMTPSQNESVVSINVDEQTAKTAGATNSEQLSVVISSKKNTASSATANPNTRSDFGSMQISISETTVPVKQLEFSINGKPVSELKSIVARSDKLDVVSSMDKVEIRIPSKNGMTTAQTRSNIATSASASKPVLNLQIAAKFNEPRFLQPRGAELKTDTPQVKPPAQPAQPKTPPVPRQPPVPSRPPRTHNFFNAESAPSEAANSAASREEAARNELSKISKGSSSVKEAESMSGSKRMGTFSKSTVQSSDENALNALNPSQTMKSTDADVKTSTSAAQQTKKQNRTDPDGRVATTVIPWWSSEASFNKIKRKEAPFKIVMPHFQNETVTPNEAKQTNAQQLEQPSNASQKTEQAEERVSATSQKVEQKLHTETAPVQKQEAEASKTEKVEASFDNPGVDPATKGSAVESDTKKRVQPDTASVVRVRSPKWVPIKTVKGSRGIKKSKYRVRSNLHVRKVSPRPNRENPYAAVKSPNVVKYIPVEVHRVNAEKKSESAEKPTAEDQSKTAQKANSQKLESEGTKLERSVVHGCGPQIGKTNVQNSNTLVKEEKEAKGDVNKSADVSAKPPASKLAIAGKEGKQPERDDTTKKSVQGKAVDVDERIKEILKSMKPIEKRKDGTLIDYGVIVPSRKPSAKARQISKIPTSRPAKAPEKVPVSSSQDKIVEPEKVSSTMKQTLTEPKSAVEQPKIVEPEKISSVKKGIGVVKADVKYEPRNIIEPQVKQLQAGKPVAEKVEQKTAAKKEKDHLMANKSGSSSVIESKSTLIPKRTSSVGIKSAASQPQTSSKVPKRPNTANVPLVGTSSNQSAKVAQKSSEGTIKSSLLEKPKIASSGVSKNLEKKEGKTVLKSPLEGTIVGEKPKELDDMSKMDLQKSSKSDTEANAKATTKTTKTDDSSLKASAIELEKNKSRTGVAPLEGTILRPPKHPNSMSKLLNVNEERKVSAGLAKQKKGDFFKFTKKPSNKGGGSGSGSEGGSSGPVGTLRGPGAPKSQYEDAETPVTCTESNRNKNPCPDSESSGAYILFPSETEMPVKNILYTSWLQRFKKKYDDDKTVQ